MMVMAVAAPLVDIACATVSVRSRCWEEHR